MRNPESNEGDPGYERLHFGDPSAKGGRIVQAWRQAQYTLIMSEPLLTEMERVLNYPKIERRLHWTPIQIMRYISLLRFYSEVVPIEQTLPIIPLNLLRDAKDIPIIATLIAGRAKWLVSLDDHLQAVRDQYPVCTPGEFLSMLGPESNR